MARKTQAVAASYTVRWLDETILVTTSTSTIVISMPKAADTRKQYEFEVLKVDNAAGTVVITPYSGDTINGASTFTLSSLNEGVILHSNGVSDWKILAQTIMNRANTVTKTATYPATVADDVILWNGVMDGTADVTLPTSGVPLGKTFTIKVIQTSGAGPLNILTSNTAEYVGNPQLYTLPAGAAYGGLAKFVWDGSAYWMITYHM